MQPRSGQNLRSEQPLCLSWLGGGSCEPVAVTASTRTLENGDLARSFRALPTHQNAGIPANTGIPASQPT
ncbi:hypothetical protein [Arthrobacter methylotrophus]|uniref:hypothetical protein n=1 Tax=Arthrobacter methylotrophus TaxID=121291 RepID=UPI0031E92CF8